VADGRNKQVKERKRESMCVSLSFSQQLRAPDGVCVCVCVLILYHTCIWRGQVWLAQFSHFVSRMEQI